MKKIILSAVITLSVISANIPAGFAEDTADNEELFGTGLADMSDERWAELEAKLPMITNIKPNEIAMSRVDTPSIQTFSLSDSNAVATAEIGDEISFDYPGQSNSGGAAQSEFPLASAVDVSQSLTFPPIANQGNTNSCVAWSLCYYQLTNNNCVIKGTAAKNTSGTADYDNIMSPKFIYPLINGGENSAAYYDEACATIMSFGCPNMSDYPGIITVGNLSAWCTDTNVWNKAIYNKPQQISYEYCEDSGPIVSGTPFVQNIKKILSDGYVVTIPTYVNSFVYTNRTTDGNYGCRYVSSSRRGGHAMTIVGYDDNYWIDVNGNGSADSGETGAFKIANSWGTSAYYYTDGYIFMPYDAIGSVSGVANAPTARISAFNRYFFIQPKKEYTPLLTAEVEMTTQNRNQVAVNVGISDTSKSVPDQMINVGNNYHTAFNNFSQSWLASDISLTRRNFSGTNSNETVTIPFDLTPVIKKAYKSAGFTEKTQKRLYVKVTDGVTADSCDVTLGNVTIKEPITGKSAACTNANPLTTSPSNPDAMKSVDFEITPFVGFRNNQPITLVFSSNIQAESAANQIFLTKDDNTYYPNYEVSGNRITVSPPANGYTYDTDYELHIGSGIKSAGGNNMQAEKTVLIYMLGAYYIFG